MECVDTLPQNNLFEDKTSTESMIAQQYPGQDPDDGKTEEATLSDASRTNISENRMNDMDEEGMDDSTQNLSFRRCKLVILSDEEEDDAPRMSVTSDAVEDEGRIGQRKTRVIGSDSESEDDGFLFSEKPDAGKPKVSYNPDIFDTELSDEDQPPLSDRRSHSPSDLQESERAVPPKAKKKVNKAKQAQQELKEIHSESQRMVRESRVSLPYHRPKQRTLAEFLARRKQTMPPKIQNQSLKMTMRNMEILKLLEEKKKQVDEFYKSDSDSEDPDDLDWTPENPEKKNVLPEAERKPATEKSVTDDTLPDLNAPSNESSTQETESQESGFEPLLVKNDTVVSSEDEGLGASEKNTSREHSSSSDISQSGDNEGLHDTENCSPLMEHMNCEDKDLKNVGIETNANTEGSDNREERLLKEPLSVMKEDMSSSSHKAQFATPSSDKTRLTTPASDKAQFITPTDDKTQLTTPNSNTAQFVTPKLRLLASKLPEEELKKIMSVTPKLSSGKKNDVIDLDERSTPSQNSGMNDFINRFLRHADATPKPTEKQHVNLNIVSKEEDSCGGERLVSSTLSVTLDAKEEQLAKEAVPGSRFTSFKAALQAKIREQREILRRKRVQEKQFMETEEIPEDYQNDDLPNEEAELTDQSETDYETESEPEENDVPIVDKKREKSAYVDDEAEEEEDEGDSEPEANDLDDATGPVSDSDNENDTSEATTKRKRIIKSADDDSEEDDVGNLTLNWDATQELESGSNPLSRSNTDDLSSLVCKKGETLDKDMSTTSFDSSFELYGSVIAGHQPGGGMKLSAENALPLSLTKNKSNSFTSTLSSSSKKQQELTLPAEESVDIFNNEAICASPAGVDLNFSSLECTQPHESNQEDGSFAKLNLDFSRIDGTQDKDELIGLCTGQFSDQAVAEPLCEDISPTQEMSELLGLCSGRFAGPKEGQNSQLKNTQDGPKTLPVSQDDPDDDELLGLCTAKFTMPTDSQAEPSPEESETKKVENESHLSPKMIIYSSEDEDSVDIKSRTVRRRKRKRVIEFSDDEDAQEPLTFDDEENEIPTTVFTGFKDNGKGGIRAEFLENEAELSGSEVNSDDEAEESEDDFEEMEGDREHFDSNVLRDQVGKAHLRSLLDSDKREVRLLQELYLEDGELHGQGRSRQFRWKNLDKRMENDEIKTLSDEEGSDDNMEDSEWRKQKIEREKFILEQKAKMTDVEAELYDVGSWSSSMQNSKGELGKRNSLTSFPSLKRKRGSFLNRDTTTLARIAEFTKDGRDVVGGAKQGGNFVFQQLGADESKEKGEDEENIGVTQNRRNRLPPKVKKAKIEKFSWNIENSQSSSSVFEFL